MAKHIAPLGQTWVSFVLGYKHTVPIGWGKRQGSGFFYKHIVPMGRGEKRLGWFFLVNMAARRDEGKRGWDGFFGKHGGPSGRWICSGGAVGLYKTLSLMKLVRRRCSMFVQKAAQAESRAVGCGMLFGQAAKPFSEHDLLGWQSILPRWGKHGLALCLVTSIPSLQDGGKGRGLVSFTNISSRWDEGKRGWDGFFW